MPGAHLDLSSDPENLTTEELHTGLVTPTFLGVRFPACKMGTPALPEDQMKLVWQTFWKHSTCNWVTFHVEALVTLNEMCNKDQQGISGRDCRTLTPVSPAPP